MLLAISKSTQSVTNENKVRLVALFVLLLTVIYMLTSFVVLPIFLVIDFGFRSFDLGKFSPLAIVSDWLVRTLKLPVKPVYLPPKRFAARIGFGFSLAILIFHIIGQGALITSGILAAFAALESLAGFCAGCYVFDFVQRILRKV